MTNRHLCIAVATMGGLADTLRTKLEEYLLELDSSISFLVVVQGVEKDKAVKISNRLNVLYSREKGLSRSRNFALENLRCEWVWFQDDDIVLSASEVNKLFSELKRANPDLTYLKIGSLEDVNVLFKDYSFHSWKSPLKALKVSSIEIIVRVSVVTDANIQFNENLGLGTQLPSCEENLFVYQLLDSRNKVSIVELAYPDIVAFHTKALDNRQIDSNSRAIARGYLLSHLSYFHRLLTLIYWSLRSEPNGIVSRWQRLKLFLDGYKRNVNN